MRSENGQKLMKVIKNPITNYLPVGIRKIGTSFTSKVITKSIDLVPVNDEPIAITVGAIARGSIDVEYVEENVSISNYPLSAAITCSKLCSAFEEVWHVT